MGRPSRTNEPAPDGRWYQPAEQKEILPEQSEKDDNGSRPRSREASAIQRAMLAEQSEMLVEQREKDDNGGRPRSREASAVQRATLPSREVWVLDAHGILYQVFHALPPMNSPQGEPVGAIYGFVRDLLTLLFEHKPDILLCAFDLPGGTFRHALDADYKANRDAMPEPLSFQIGKIRDVLDAFGIPALGAASFEADDIMATVADQVEKNGGHCVLVTADKDCRQLITEKVSLFNLRKQLFYRAEDLLNDWGIRPDQVIDFQAMVGDSSDNVPGIPLIGPKMASQLLQRYGTLENIFDHADEVPGQKKRENLQNGRAIAEKSRKLVTLRKDVPLEIDWDAAVFHGINAVKMRRLFREFGFRSLTDKIDRLAEEFGSFSSPDGGDEAEPDEEAQEDVRGFPLFRPSRRTAAAVLEKGTFDPAKVTYHLINDREGLDRFLQLLRNHLADTENPFFSLDLETTALELIHADIVGLSFCWSPAEAWYLAVRAPLGEEKLPVREVLQTLQPVLEDARIGKIGQNLKYDMLILRKFGVFVRGVVFDTILADYLLHPGEMNHSLDALAERYLDHETIKITELIGTGKKQKRMDEVPSRAVAEYAGEDALIPWLLKPLLENRLREQGVMTLYETLELPLIEILTELEFNGITIDTAQLRELSGHYKKKLLTLEQEIHALVGEDFNIASPKQLQTILFDRLRLPVFRKTKTGPSTDMEVLEQLAPLHPLPAKVMEYRQAAKLKGTYIDALPLLADEKTHRIHASFNQVVTATGRLSSSNPNLQNIPIRTTEGREIRTAFIPGDGYDFILACDYSQVELRVLAHFSDDERLCAAFAQNEDIHTSVAAEVFHVPPGEVTSEMRRHAKTVNFGVIYGQSPFGLARQLGISQEEAAVFIKTYFERFAAIETFMNQVLDGALRDGYVSTFFGRRRSIRGIRPVRKGQFNMEERIAINTVIQGTAADLMKMAMLAVHRKLRETRLPVQMLLQIHDELVFEMSADAAEELETLLKREMTLNQPLRVPLQVEIKSGKTWGF
jgi:DNA polymerase-1